MKKNYLKLLVIFSLIIGTSFSVKAFDLDEEYYKNAFIIGAYFNTSQKDMFCLGKNAIPQLSPTNGKSNTWFFTQVVNSEGGVLGYAITQDAPNSEGYASTFLCENKNESTMSSYALGFQNIMPAKPIPREAIFSFEKQNSIDGTEVYKIKNLGNGKYLKGSFTSGQYTGKLTYTTESSATKWSLTAVEKNTKEFYSNPKLSGENSISSFTFKLVNPENNTALSTNKEDKNTMGGGYKIKMTEINNADYEQLWHFIPVKGYPGYYFIRNMENGLYFAGLNSKKALSNSSDSYPNTMVYLYYSKDDSNIRIHYYSFGEKKFLLTGNSLNTLQLVRFDKK